MVPGTRSALIITGVTAFFAYNWGGLHKFWKFGLIEVGIVASVGGAWLRGLDSSVGRSAWVTSSCSVDVRFVARSRYS